MGPRRRGRELAFQILYQMDLGRSSIAYTLTHFIDLSRAPANTRNFAEELATGAAAELKTLDELISSHAKNWNFARLSSVDRALLRLGAYELIHRNEIPAEVTLNECIELAKAYGTDDSPAFVNGILDQILRGQGPQPAKVAKKKAAKA